MGLRRQERRGWVKSTEVWAQTAGTHPVPASAVTGAQPALNLAAGAAASLPFQSGLLLGDTDVTRFCPSHTHCWAAGMQQEGLRGTGLREVLPCLPDLVPVLPSSEMASRAVPLICLFSCTLVFGSFVLGCVSVPKATRHGSWNAGSG